MVLLNDMPTKLAMITGKYVLSGGCTDVIGGVMTAGATTAAAASAKLTWLPAFISAPVCIATIVSGPAAVTAPTVWFSGVTACGAYIVGATGGGAANSGCTIGVMLIGETRL